MMLESQNLQDIAKAIVAKRLPEVCLEAVLTENTSTSEGEVGVIITLVLAPESVDAISGDAALKLLVDIHDGLRREGEVRFPILEYATADDLEGDGE
jgi:hypothetical protein